MREQGNGGGVANVWTPQGLKNWETSVLNDNGEYVPYRPLGYPALRLIQRLKLAWGVFTGRYDVLKWPI